MKRREQNAIVLVETVTLLYYIIIRKLKGKSPLQILLITCLVIAIHLQALCLVV